MALKLQEVGKKLNMFLLESHNREMLLNINLFPLYSLYGGACGACAVLLLSTGEWGEAGSEAKKGGDHQTQTFFFYSIQAFLGGPVAIGQGVMVSNQRTVDLNKV